MMLFVDANVIAKAFVQDKDTEKCSQILEDDFITNTLCLAEAQHVISVITGNKAYAGNCIKSLFKSRAIIIELDRNLFFESLKRVEKYDLPVFDLIHYVTALLNDCSEFISYDKDFDNLELKRVEP